MTLKKEPSENIVGKGENAGRVFLGLGEDIRRPSKGEKCTTKAIFGENFL